MNHFLRHFFVFCLLFFVARLSAQQNTKVRVTTQDGRVVAGTLTSMNDSILVIKATNMGNITLQRAQVTDIETIAADGTSTHSSDSRFWQDNPHTSRYFFSTNGYGLREGEGYYQNTWLLYNQVSLGFTDYFSMGVGTIPTFLFGSGELPVFLMPQLSFPVLPDKFNVGIGVLATTVVGASDDDRSSIVVYGNATFGSRENNFGLGIGYPYGREPVPTFIISGMKRVRRKLAFVTENYVYPAGVNEGVILISGGVRYVAPSLSIDAAFLTPFSRQTTNFLPLPWLGITVPFKTAARKHTMGKGK
jgi:small nuclear ribonucleoprotein (snRNP)-like protein